MMSCGPRAGRASSRVIRPWLGDGEGCAAPWLTKSAPVDARRLASTFADLADGLVDDFDANDLPALLATRCAEGPFERGSGHARLRRLKVADRRDPL